jgi:hypothetical protein
MENGERSGPGDRNDWPVRLCTVAGTFAGAAVAIFVIKPLVEIPGFWLGVIAFAAVTGAGGALGSLVGWWLFRQPPK